MGRAGKNISRHMTAGNKSPKDYTKMPSSIGTTSSSKNKNRGQTENLTDTPISSKKVTNKINV
jgi:hypothetical protein